MRTLPLALAAAIPCTRQYDLILVGSTGFTGKLASKYLASRLTNWLPKHDSNHRQVSWAISGRSKIDLENLQAELATMPSACLPDVILADLVVDGVEGLQEKIAAKSRVVLSTAGPFAKYGNDLVAACVTSGTDYCDITGGESKSKDCYGQTTLIKSDCFVDYFLFFALFSQKWIGCGA